MLLERVDLRRVGLLRRRTSPRRRHSLRASKPPQPFRQARLSDRLPIVRAYMCCGLRCSPAKPAGQGLVHSKKDLKQSSLSPFLLSLLLRKSKTDQEGEGTHVLIAPDTLDYLKAWIENSAITEGAIFRSIRKGSGTIEKTASPTKRKADPQRKEPPQAASPPRSSKNSPATPRARRIGAGHGLSRRRQG